MTIVNFIETGKHTDYSVIAMVRPFSTAYPIIKIDHKSAKESMFVGIVSRRPERKHNLAMYTPVPLKENCTVSPVVDIFIAA